MRKPINFNKINERIIRINGEEYRLSMDVSNVSDTPIESAFFLNHIKGERSPYWVHLLWGTPVRFEVVRTEWGNGKKGKMLSAIDDGFLNDDMFRTPIYFVYYLTNIMEALQVTEEGIGHKK